MFSPVKFSTVCKYVDPQPEDRVLEIGCNRGEVTLQLQPLVSFSCGIDANPGCFRSTGLSGNFFVMDATHLEFQDCSFNKIYSAQTIEHIQNIDQAFSEMERVLAPKGRIVLVYPAEPFRGLFALKSALVIYKNPLRALDIHVHRFWPGKIKSMVAPTTLVYKESHFPVDFLPQFLTILEKT